MKIRPIAFLKSLKPLAFLKSLSWNKQDVKQILTFGIMLIIGCFILNRFLHIKVEIVQGWGDSLTVDSSVSVDGSVYVDGSVDADVSGSVYSDVSGYVSVDQGRFW